MSEAQDTTEAADGQSLLTDGLGSEQSIVRDAMRYRALKIKGIRFGGVVSIEWEPDVLDRVLDNWILEGDTGHGEAMIKDLLESKPGSFIRVA